MSKKQSTFHQISLDSLIDVAPETIKRFIDSALQHNPIDGNDAFDVALVLQALGSGASRDINMNTTIRKVMGIPRKKRRKKQVDPASFEYGGTAWKIVERKVKGEITRAEGLRLFEREIINEVDQRTLERWFDELVPKVERYFADQETMIQLARKNSDK